MSADQDKLIAYALGTDSADERAAIESQLAVRDDLREQLAEVITVLEHIAPANPPVAPRPEVRKRLLDSVAATPRLEGYLERLARLFDLGVGAMRDILARAQDDTAAWEMAAVPGVQLFHFQGGPRVAAADCGLVRLAPGSEFPRHRHRGDEVALILQGQVRDDAGCEFYPGDVAPMTRGSRHSFKAVGEHTLLLAVVIETGIQFE